jgi:hypothetical protein
MDNSKAFSRKVSYLSLLEPEFRASLNTSEIRQIQKEPSEARHRDGA